MYTQPYALIIDKSHTFEIFVLVDMDTLMYLKKYFQIVIYGEQLPFKKYPAHAAAFVTWHENFTDKDTLAWSLAKQKWFILHRMSSLSNKQTDKYNLVRTCAIYFPNYN